MRYRFLGAYCIALLAISLSAAPAPAAGKKTTSSDQNKQLCEAALTFCMAACEINNEHNNTGGFDGLPLLSFKADCNKKCADQWDACVGNPSRTAPQVSLPSRSLLDGSSDLDQGPADGGSGGTRGKDDIVNPGIGDAPVSGHRGGGIIW